MLPPPIHQALFTLEGALTTYLRVDVCRGDSRQACHLCEEPSEERHSMWCPHYRAEWCLESVRAALRLG
jgi:hypothetical protein